MKAKTQRTKKSPLSIDAGFPTPYETVKFKIRITPDALKSLYFLSLGEPKAVGETVAHILEPWYNTLARKPGRGIHSGREAFTVRIKIIIAYIDSRVTYWFRIKRKRWPEPLRDTIKEMVEQLQKDRSSGKIDRVRISPHKITAFIMEKYYGKERRLHGLLKWTDNPERFRKAMIDDNEFTKWFEHKATRFPPFWNATPIITRKDPPDLINLLESLQTKPPNK
jgi:hypothetical protein